MHNSIIVTVLYMYVQYNSISHCSSIIVYYKHLNKYTEYSTREIEINKSIIQYSISVLIKDSFHLSIVHFITS